MNRSALFRRALVAVAAAAVGALALAADDSPHGHVLKPGAEKPANAVVLFDGKDTSHWTVAGSDQPCNWEVEDGTLVDDKNDIQTKDKFKDFQLHLEFNEPKLGPEFKG